MRARVAEAKDPIAEDWGWCVVVKTSPVRLNVAVSNVEESTTRWRVFAWGGGDLKREVAALREQLVAVLQDVPEMSELTWEELA